MYKGFIFYQDWWTHASALSEAERTEFFTAIIEYGICGTERAEYKSERVELLFSVVKLTLDRQHAKSKGGVQ